MNYRNLIFIGLSFVFIFGILGFIIAGRGAMKVAEPALASDASSQNIPNLEKPDVVAQENTNNRQLDALIAANVARRAPALREGQWINSQPTTLENLRGQVVLVDFWTYGCYNCRNTLPTLKRLDKTYRDKGLTVLGIHTPESESEKIFANVQKAVEKYEIKYPVLTDAKGDS